MLNNGASEVTITTQIGKAPKVVKVYKCKTIESGDVMIEKEEDITLKRATLIRQVLRSLV